MGKGSRVWLGEEGEATGPNRLAEGDKLMERCRRGQARMSVGGRAR